MIKWFLHIGTEDVLVRLWKAIVLLFLQRPVLAILPAESITVHFDSQKYSVHDEVRLQEGQTVVALLPPIYCAPENVAGAKLGFEGCHSTSRTILRKGTVDQLG